MDARLPEPPPAGEPGGHLPYSGMPLFNLVASSVVPTLFETVPPDDWLALDRRVADALRRRARVATAREVRAGRVY